MFVNEKIMIKITRLYLIAILLVASIALLGCFDSHFDFKAEKILELKNYASLMGESNYSEKTWNDITIVVDQAVDKIKKAGSEQDILLTFNETVKTLNTYAPEKTPDFLLTIKIDDIVIVNEKNIEIYISLKNQSGHDVEISYYLLFIPIIPTGINIPALEQPQFPTVVNFLNDTVIENKYDLGGYFLPGKHKIEFRAIFDIYGGEESQSNFKIYSNSFSIYALN